jgi:AraC family transcriptional regulator of adaptative response/methylated-DNA-[protein]-cysteine methyltransferase
MHACDRHSSAALQPPFSTEAERWDAVERRDGAADGYFVYGVLTTGVYCRPSCPSRLAKRRNVKFYDLHAHAEADGHRPCRRCRPKEPSKRQLRTEIVERACRLIEADPGRAIGEIADALKVSRHYFQRTFKTHTGLGPKAYQSAVRRDAAVRALRNGARVTDAVYASGYRHASRFYEGVGRQFGMPPSAARRGARGERIDYAFAQAALGRIVVATSTRGVCVVRFGLSDAQLLAELRETFPSARLVAAEPLAERLARVVSGLERDTARENEELPFDIRTTAFEARVCAALQALAREDAAASTERAGALGAPDPSRAVA